MFQREANAEPMIATLSRYRDGGRFLLHGFVVMPDHVHVLISPIASLEQTVGLTKGGFSFAVRKQYAGAVWQDGYYAHRVVDDRDFAGQLAYIAANPERRGLMDYEFVHTHAPFMVDAVPERFPLQPPG